LDQVKETKINLIVDFVRNDGPEKAGVTLCQVQEVRDKGVIGVGLGGAELEYPPELFEKVYANARSLGFHTCAHAGEGAGAGSIWGAIRRLQVERIGHGTRAGEDPSLLDYLAATGLPLEMCPLSNVATGVVRCIGEHPIRQYFERGLKVTVNTDDPGMFGNSLAGEYRALVEKLGFSRSEIQTLVLNGIDASWLPMGEKQKMVREFKVDPAWND
jgi:adenosine deaminase